MPPLESAIALPERDVAFAGCVAGDDRNSGVLVGGRHRPSFLAGLARSRDLLDKPDHPKDRISERDNL